MADPNLGERVAQIEGVLKERVLTGLDRMEGKLDDALAAMHEKGSRAAVAEAHAEIDEIKLTLKDKADKKELETTKQALSAELGQVKLTLAKWAGIGIAVAMLVNWFGKGLITLLAQ